MVHFNNTLPMSENSQKKNIMLAVAGFTAAVAVIAVIGTIVFKQEPEIIQGYVEVSEYRVSSKVPGRVLELMVKEGDYVNVGDTLAILDAPDVRAKLTQAESAESAASALDQMANNGARHEQVSAALALLQQAKAGLEIAQKSYNRVQRLYDEAFANYKAVEAQVKAAQSQYDMAVNGARREEKMVAAAQVNRAKGAVQEVNSYIHEAMQTAQKAGEVSDIYPKEGELIGTGSPIMTVSLLDDMWGTFNVREDQLNGMRVGSTFTAFVPAFKKDIQMKVYYIKDQGSYATWKATKANGQYDLKTFEVKARPVSKIEGLRPGMSLIIKK